MISIFATIRSPLTLFITFPPTILQIIIGTSSGPDYETAVKSVISAVMSVLISEITIRSVVTTTQQGDKVFIYQTVNYNVEVVNGNSTALISALNTAVITGEYSTLLHSIGFTRDSAVNLPIIEVSDTALSSPTSQPSSQPTSPSSQPTGLPTTEPTGQPTAQPSSQPTQAPSSRPTTTSAPSHLHLVVLTVSQVTFIVVIFVFSSEVFIISHHHCLLYCRLPIFIFCPLFLLLRSKLMGSLLQRNFRQFSRVSWSKY